MLYLPSVLKRCPACRQYRLFNEFAWNKCKRDGLQPNCKQCNRVYREKHKERITEYNTHYRRDHLEKSRRASRQYYHDNKESLRVKKRVYHQKTAEHIAERDRIRRKTHPEQKRMYENRREARKRLLSHTFSVSDWQYALDYFGYCCAICGRKRGFWHTLAQGHWIPLVKDGGYTADNIIPLCHGVAGCNNRQGDKLPEIWLVDEFGKRKAQHILKRIHDYFDSVSRRNSPELVPEPEAAI